MESEDRRQQNTEAPVNWKLCKEIQKFFKEARVGLIRIMCPVVLSMYMKRSL